MIEHIHKKINSREPKSVSDRYISSVLIPIIEIKGKEHILFQVRSKNLKSQPGEICFPGGKVESGETYKAAAIRETTEELNIKKENIRILGEVDYLISQTGTRINAFVGTISGINVDKIKPNKDEVDHLFTVPLNFFIKNEPKIYKLQTKVLETEGFPYHLIPNGKNYKFDNKSRPIHFYKYNDYIIWGYTAWILKKFIDIIR